MIISTKKSVQLKMNFNKNERIDLIIQNDRNINYNYSKIKLKTIKMIV